MARWTVDLAESLAPMLTPQEQRFVSTWIEMVGDEEMAHWLELAEVAKSAKVRRLGHERWMVWVTTPRPMHVVGEHPLVALGELCDLLDLAASG